VVSVAPAQDFFFPFRKTIFNAQRRNQPPRLSKLAAVLMSPVTSILFASALYKRGILTQKQSRTRLPNGRIRDRMTFVQALHPFCCRASEIKLVYRSGVGEPFERSGPRIADGYRSWESRVGATTDARLFHNRPAAPI
jgi:hypothetical protein